MDRQIKKKVDFFDWLEAHPEMELSVIEDEYYYSKLYSSKGSLETLVCKSSGKSVEYSLRNMIYDFNNRQYTKYPRFKLVQKSLNKYVKMIESRLLLEEVMEK